MCTNSQDRSARSKGVEINHTMLNASEHPLENKREIRCEEETRGDHRTVNHESSKAQTKETREKERDRTGEFEI